MTISFMSFFTTFVLQNDSELYGRTLRVNAAKPLRLKESSTRPVWADDEWLQKYSGQVSFYLYLTHTENLYLDLSSLGRFRGKNNRGWGDRRRRGRGRRRGGKEAGCGRGKFGRSKIFAS